MISPQEMQAGQALLKATPQSAPVQGNSQQGGSWYDQMNSTKLPGSTTQQPVQEQAPKSNVPSSPQLDLSKPIVDTAKNVASDIGTEFGGSSEGVGAKLGSDISEGAKDIQSGNPIKGVIKTGARVAGDVAGAVYTPISAVLGGVLKTTGIQKGIDWLGQQIAEKSGITDIPAIQKWAMTHPNAAQDFGRAMNIGMASMDSSRVEPSTILDRTKEQVKSGIDTLTKETPVETPPKKVTPLNESDITDKYNKAIKPSITGKNTATQVVKANSNVLTGLKAISENKANLNFTDSEGLQVECKGINLPIRYLLINWLDLNQNKTIYL